MKVIIAGGRYFDNYDLLKEKCDKILSNCKVTWIAEGGAKGADALGVKYGYENMLNIKTFPANWE